MPHPASRDAAGGQDKRHNAAYRKLMASLKGERKKQSLETQRLVGKYTEANCGFYYEQGGGRVETYNAQG